MTKVLVFPSGTEIGLEIVAALSAVKGVQLAGANVPGVGHGPFVLNEHYDLPGVDAPEWPARFHELVVRAGIDVVFPAHDDVLLALSELDKPSALVLGSNRETCRLTRYKSLTYARLEAHLRVPRRYREPDEVKAFPVFCKPDRGQGSQGAYRLDGPADLTTVRWSGGDIVTEYLPGREFTVDCFTDRHGRLLFAGGRERLRVRNGISVATRPVEDERFFAIAGVINNELDLRGAWFFQVKEAEDGDLVLLEVAPRIAGAMAVHRAMGVNLAQLTLLDAQGVDLVVPKPRYRVRMDRALVNRFCHEGTREIRRLYIDWDDTLSVSGSLNWPAVRLVLQCVGRGIPVVLVTRHEGDIHAVLQKSRLASAFDEIHVVPRGVGKSSVMIADPGALFVDDSFAERWEVEGSTGMLCIDPTAVEAFIDDRR